MHGIGEQKTGGIGQILVFMRDHQALRPYRFSRTTLVNAKNTFSSPLRQLTFTGRKLSGWWCLNSAPTSSTRRQ
jgi:hypothetical protein